DLLSAVQEFNSVVGRKKVTNGSCLFRADDIPTLSLPCLRFSMDVWASENHPGKGLPQFREKTHEVLKSLYDFDRSQVRISVEGYDTWLPLKDIIDALDNHFKSCGEIWDIEVPRDPVTNAIDRRSFVVLRGEGAEEKALQLNGSDMGGWKAAVKAIPMKDSEFTTDQLAAMTVAHFQRNRSRGISVTGYDTSVPADEVKRALRKHFSSCGQITDVFVLNSRALVYFFGIGAVDNALKRSRRKVERSASGVGGWRLVAKALPLPKPEKKQVFCVGLYLPAFLVLARRLAPYV
ncbi:unnamed protein product, partial [Thlaspi arvense]